MLAGFAWEEDQPCTVGLQSVNVGGEGFCGEVPATMVDGDADRGSQSAGDAGFL